MTTTSLFQLTLSPALSSPELLISKPLFLRGESHRMRKKIFQVEPHLNQIQLHFLLAKGKPNLRRLNDTCIKFDCPLSYSDRFRYLNSCYLVPWSGSFQVKFGFYRLPGLIIFKTVGGLLFFHIRKERNV